MYEPPTAKSISLANKATLPSSLKSKTAHRIQWACPKKPLLRANANTCLPRQIIMRQNTALTIGKLTSWQLKGSPARSQRLLILKMQFDLKSQTRHIVPFQINRAILFVVLFNANNAYWANFTKIRGIRTFREIRVEVFCSVSLLIFNMSQYGNHPT